jgi:hypothetical protein
MISVESIFGLNDERLTIRHDSGMGAEPYVQGAIWRLKKINTFKGSEEVWIVFWMKHNNGYKRYCKK